MANSDHNTQTVVQDLDTMDLSQLDEDTQIDVTLALLDHYVSELEARGIAAEVMDTVLFSAFVSRLSERGARDEFDDFVAQAQEEDWPAVTVH